MKKSDPKKKKPKATFSKERKIVEKKSGGRTYTGDKKKAALKSANDSDKIRANNYAAKMKAAGYLTANQKEKERRKQFTQSGSRRAAAIAAQKKRDRKKKS